jgi:hypothetical protein
MLQRLEIQSYGKVKFKEQLGVHYKQLVLQSDRSYRIYAIQFIIINYIFIYSLQII